MLLFLASYSLNLNQWIITDISAKYATVISKLNVRSLT